MSPTTSAALLALRPLLAVALALAGDARAQTPACEQFKQVLATRLRLDTQHFTLEAVPVGTAPASAAKAVGTCGGGAYRIVQVRKGEIVSPPPAAVRPVVASATPPTSASVAPPRPTAPAVQAPLVAASAALVVVAEPPAPAPADRPAASVPAAGFLDDHGRWLLPLLALALGAWGWRWFTHGRYYDKAGLPRGPKF